MGVLLRQRARAMTNILQIVVHTRAALIPHHVQRQACSNRGTGCTARGMAAALFPDSKAAGTARRKAPKRRLDVPL